MTKQSFLTASLMMLCVLSSGLVLWQNLTLRSNTPLSSAARFIQAGANIHGVELIDATGNEITTAFDRPLTKYLILWFTPDCLACETHLKEWKVLVDGIRTSGASFKMAYLVPEGVAPRRAERYLAAAEIDFSDATLFYVSPRRRVEMALGATPTTLLVRSGGTVDRVWSGPWSRGDLLSIVRDLGIAVTGSAGGN
jgi:hypothetical protein